MTEANTPDQTKASGLVDEASLAGRLQALAKAEYAHADEISGGSTFSPSHHCRTRAVVYEVGAIIVAALTDGQSAPTAAKAEVEGLRKELQDASKALVPLDAVVHHLGIEDSDDDPVETIKAIEAQRDAALAELASEKRVAEAGEQDRLQWRERAVAALAELARVRGKVTDEEVTDAVDLMADALVVVDGNPDFETFWPGCADDLRKWSDLISRLSSRVDEAERALTTKRAGRRKP